jgi:hypothetical protein
VTTFRKLLAIAVLAGSAAACAAAGGPTTTMPGLTTLPPVATAPVVTAAPTLPHPIPAGLCESYADPLVTGTVSTPDLDETSGIAASRNHPGVLWMHNDSGGGSFVYAVDRTGAYLGRFELDVAAFDWEDMAIGPGPDPSTDYLYLGDIGDNLHIRNSITVYRVAEPDPAVGGGTIATVARFDLTYPEPGYDAEAMAVDPVTGDILIVTKPGSGGDALILRAPAAGLADGATTALLPVATFPLDSGIFVTGADIDRTGAAILFRGYNQVWLWARADLDFTRTFDAEPCRTPSTAEVQGEAIGFDPEGFSYFTVSEGTNPDINLVQSRLEPVG